MTRLLSRGLLAATFLALAACGSDSDNDATIIDPPAPAPTAQLQVVHAAADAPDVNVLVNGTVPAGLAGVPFKAASPYLELDAGTIDAAVNAILPDGSEVEVLAAPGLALDADIAYTVIAAGSTSDLLTAAANGNPLQLFLLTRPVEAAIAGVRIQVLHGSPSAPEVDVYVSAPDAELATVTPATFAFGETLDLGTVPAAEYRIRITPTGSDTVVFDSGAVALPEGADLSIVAVDNVGPGASPVALLAVFGDGTVAELRDGGAAAPAGLTAVHNSADAPTVCVVADDAGTADVERVELFAGVPFRGFGYLGEVPPGSYLVGLEVFDDQAGCAGTSAVTFDTPVDFAAGAEATGIVVGSLGGGTLDLLPLADDLRPIATEARVRIVHGSAATPAVDIYVVAAGTDITSPDVTPAFSGVEFTASTGFVALPPGDYDVFVTLAGDTTPAIAVEGAAFAGGDVISAIASDPAGDETAPGLILIDHVELKNPPL
jgi:hypothetical protein